MFEKIPFLKFTLAMIFGILLEIYLPFALQFAPIIFIIFSVVFTVVVFFCTREIKNFLKPYLGFLSVLIFFFFGILITRNKNIFNHTSHLATIQDSIVCYVGNINSEVEVKENTIKFELKIEKIRQHNEWIAVSGKVLIYIYKSGYAGNLTYGDNILIRGSPQLISEPLNPGEFNLKRFYAFHGISHRHFIKNTDVKILSQRSGNQLIGYSIMIRQNAEQLFRKYIKSDRERLIASALILGIKGDIDDEIERAYASTGTMHVLAVSGMHVGIIYKILQYMLFFLDKIRKGKVIKAGILVILLWFYAFVTGLCPSVLRAVAMFSFIIIAEAANRKSAIFNTLALSCMILLSYNPYFLMEVGFQLSFLAVGGIIYLQPKIYALIDVENKVLDWFWAVTSVSLAAQLATFPLGLLYFHQFPNYFLLSNLVVIPVAIAIMGAGLLFVFFWFWEWIEIWLGLAVKWSVWGLNWIILLLESLPYSTFQGVSIDVFDTWLIYLIIIFGILIWENKNFKTVVIWCLLSVLLVVLQLIEVYDFSKQHKLIIYNINKASAIDMIDGFNLNVLAKPEVTENHQKMQFHVLNHRWSKGTSNASVFTNFQETNFGKYAVWQGYKIMIIDKKNQKIPTQIVDILLIQNNSVYDLQKMLTKISFKKLVLDGSNSEWYIKKMTIESKRLEIIAHFTSIDGAFEVEL